MYLFFEATYISLLDWSESFLIFQITYDLLSDYRGMAKWFGAHYKSSAVKCKKGPQVLTFQQLSVRKDPRS